MSKLYPDTRGWTPGDLLYPKGSMYTFNGAPYMASGGTTQYYSGVYATNGTDFFIQTTTGDRLDPESVRNMSYEMRTGGGYYPRPGDAEKIVLRQQVPKGDLDKVKQELAELRDLHTQLEMDYEDAQTKIAQLNREQAALSATLATVGNGDAKMMEIVRRVYRDHQECRDEGLKPGYAGNDCDMYSDFGRALGRHAINELLAVVTAEEGSDA